MLGCAPGGCGQLANVFGQILVTPSANLAPLASTFGQLEPTRDNLGHPSPDLPIPGNRLSDHSVLRRLRRIRLCLRGQLAGYLAVNFLP